MIQESTPGPLIDAMERQAEDERTRISVEAEARSKEILAAADVECQRLKAKALQELEKELLVLRQRTLGEAVMQAREKRLRMKRQMLEVVFQRAREEIGRRMIGADAQIGLALLAAEARTAAGESCEVIVRAEDGVVLAVSSDGKRRVDNGPYARLLHAQSYAEQQVARLLFGGDAGGRT